MQWKAAFGSRGGCGSFRWFPEGGSWYGLPGSAFSPCVVQGPDWGTQPYLQVRVASGTTPHFKHPIREMGGSKDEF